MRSLAALALCTLIAPATALGFPTAGHGDAVRGHNVSRALRSFVKTTRDTKTVVLPKNAKDYRYVLVKGLIGDNYPRYMARDYAALKDRGLDVEFAPINTGAGVAHNSAIIEQMIKTTDKPIVFIGHSKGVADTTDAIGRLAKQDPAMVQSRVRGLVALQGAYKGSPVADSLAGKSWGVRAMKTLAWAVRGSVDSGMDIRTSARLAVINDHPMPTQLVPTVSFIGYKTSLVSALAPGIWFLKKFFKLRSDGLVGHHAAHIDGSDYAYGAFDHATGAFGRNSDRIMLGLLGHVLEQPQLKLAE
jgi:hypothetical protein